MLTQARVRELFDYDDGKLYWRIATSNRVHVGKEAGVFSAKDGYHRVGVDGGYYLRHRLIFLWHHGWLPPEIDHKDTDPTNSRIENLRPLSHSDNIANVTTTTSNTGVRGVSRCKHTGRYYSQVMKNDKNHHLGMFDTIEEATTAYKDAKQKLFPANHQK